MSEADQGPIHWVATAHWVIEHEPTLGVTDDVLDRFGAGAEIDFDELPEGDFLMWVTFGLEAGALREAVELAERRASRVLGEVVIGIEVLTASEHRRRRFQPRIPELIGYDEVAVMAGVSLEQAQLFAALPDFPREMLQTPGGALMVRAHAEEWVQSRSPLRARRWAPRTGTRSP